MSGPDSDVQDLDDEAHDAENAPQYADEDPAGTGATAGTKKRSFIQSLRALLPSSGSRGDDDDEKKEGVRGSGADDDLPPDQRRRTWEFSMSINNFENVTNETMDIFFTVEIGHANKKKRSKLKMKLLYTQMYTLKKGESADLSKPVDLIRNVWFRMPYRDMRNHVIRIDLWKVSKWTLNTYFGTCERTLWSIATSSMDLGVMIKKKLTKQEVAKKKTPYDVARVRCSISLEEIFDFRISFDNWTFKTNPDHPDAGKINGERKKITLIVPKNRRAKASVHSLLRPHNSKARSSQWCDCDDGQYFWAKPSPRPFVFTGTRTYLSNSYFCVSVDTGDPPLGLDSGAYPGTQIGKALLGLTSILEISVFKGTVKALSNETNRYKVGELVGNVKAMECSYGRDTAEFDIVTRPEQPKGAGMVTHLNETEQHLVVRITKCEGLPVADFDTGSSDPYLRVKWDGMVLLSPVLQRTIRPVFNHSFFFPVRLAYQQMRKDLRYAKALEVEMLCKGPVDIQVWDDDETSSDFLGGYLLDVADIIGTKHKEARTIVGAGKKRVKLEDDDSNATRTGACWTGRATRSCIPWRAKFILFWAGFFPCG
eukprot:GEMP01016864.1.p1 GENE.GEMP01016864.1~~GEMP01016864.1.p1  ORF type:complete len:595 (+),score=134.10 GEMP01016864.1:328-2112(+)